MNTAIVNALNWARNGDGLEIITEERPAETLPDQNARPDQRPSRFSRIMHFAEQHAIEIAVADLLVNWCG